MIDEKARIAGMDEEGKASGGADVPEALKTGLYSVIEEAVKLGLGQFDRLGGLIGAGDWAFYEGECFQVAAPVGSAPGLVSLAEWDGSPFDAPADEVVLCPCGHDGEPVLKGQAVWVVGSGTAHKVYGYRIVGGEAMVEVGAVMPIEARRLAHGRPVPDTWELLEQEAMALDGELMPDSRPCRTDVLDLLHRARFLSATEGEGA